MPEKAANREPSNFDSITEASIQETLSALGGREIDVEENWRAGERYGVSVKGRRFVFRDPTAFYRFEEFVRTELVADRAAYTD